MSQGSNRRQFLASSAAASAGLAVPYFFSVPQRKASGFQPEEADRFVLGAIGVGGRGHGIANESRRFGDIVAIADVDAHHAENANNGLAGGNAEVSADYRSVLDNEDIDAVTIGTPDHWHSKIAIEAMQAGKHVYCEKPLTLTIEEGFQIRKVQHETGKVFQVGTQQRSEFGRLFLTAVALCQEGRIGKVQNVKCYIGGGPSGGPYEKRDPPEQLDWEMWLGQAPLVDYIPQRCHNSFRWWLEYSGGKMTDWGAHHVDIAHWCSGLSETGPTSVEALSSTLPVPFRDGYPLVDDQFNTPSQFHIQCLFDSGQEIEIFDGPGNGIQITGETGDIWVDRGNIRGSAIDELGENPLPEEALVRAYKGRQPTHHMENFFRTISEGGENVSDVDSHVRAMTTCHLANLSIRLGRKLDWDPEAEVIVGDDDAAQWVRREQREGYEIDVEV